MRRRLLREREEKGVAMEVDDFFLVKLKLETPFKNPGSATAVAIAGG